MGILPLTGTGGFYTPIENAMKASVAAVNAKGGVKGHPLHLTVCDSGSGSSATATCGAQAVSSHAVAVLEESADASFLPYLEKAGIPDISSGVAQQTGTSQDAFAFWAGDLAVAGPIATSKRLGCSSEEFIFDAGQASNPSEEAGISALAGIVAKTVGITNLPVVFVPAGTVDDTPIVAKALQSHPQCLVLQGLGTGEVGLIRASVNSGTSAKLITIDSYLPPTTVQSLGSLMNKIIVVTDVDSQTDTSNPAVQQAVSDITQYGPKPPVIQAVEEYTWAKVQLLSYALNHAATMNASGVKQYLSSLNCYNPVLLPPVNFTKPGNPLLPRIFNPVLASESFQNGKFYRNGDFYNVLTGQSVPFGPTATCPT
jgi:ABC-type branched-subunit amino acid transport system substrate-binding protein